MGLSASDFSRFLIADRLLGRFTELEPAPLERLESVDMLRALEHGLKVRLVETPFRTLSVDEPEEVAAVEKAMDADPISARY